MKLQSCLDILPAQVTQDRKIYNLHIFKQGEDYIIDYCANDGMACFFARGKDLYQASDHILQILQYKKIIC